MSPIDVNNPDHLAFVAFSLDDFENRLQHDAVKLSSASRFLDSLAHLAVCNPRDQVVAVGADLKTDGVDIFVAENKDVEPQVTSHLQQIMDRLFEIHSALREQENITQNPSTSLPIGPLKSLPYIAGDDTRHIPSLLRQLELSILRHSFPKVAGRIHKVDRYASFKRGVGRFLAFCTGKAMNDQDDDSTYDGKTATSIPYIENIYILVFVMHSASNTSTEPSDSDLEKFRSASTSLEIILRKSSPDFEALQDFFRSRVGYIPDVKRWLLKIVSTRTHFRWVVAIIDSSHLSQFFKHRATVHPLANPSQSISFTITRESFNTLLNAAGWDWTPTDGGITIDKTTMADKIYKQLAKELRRLANKRPVEITVSVRGPSTEASVLDEFEIETLYGAHCECIILQHLKDAMDRPTQFVGVSKLSCRLCQEYFAATAAHMGAGYHTSGSHGQLARWRCPVSSSTEVRRRLGVKLLAIVKEKLESSAIKHARSLSQSTIPSDDSDTSDLSDNIHRVAQMRNKFMADHGSPSAEGLDIDTFFV